MFFFSDEPFALILLVAVIIVPIGLVLLNAILGNKIIVILKAPQIGAKRQMLSWSLEAENEGFLPLSPVRCKVQCKNVVTGERSSKEILFPLGTKAKRNIKLNLESSYCGTTMLSINELESYDVLGLFATKVKCDEQAEVVVLPDTFPVSLTVSTHLAKDLEADEYSQERHGSDPSETFAIREYQPGDNLRRIHWKLSNKFEELLVKESALPVRHSFMVLLETSFKDKRAPKGDVLDALIEITLSLGQAMTNEEITYDIGWQDYESGSFFRSNVRNTEELTGVVNRLLHVRFQQDENGVCNYFADEYGENQFEHIVYVSPFLSNQLELVSAEARTSAIICNNGDIENAGAIEEGNLNLHFCTPLNYEKELHVLEI